MGKKPSFQFYPGDWMKDPELRSCSPGARGLWVDMMCLMFESQRRGYLLINGQRPTEEQIGRMTGCTTEEVSLYLHELRQAGVFSSDGIGVIYCRRLVRDAEISSIRKTAGKQGGNPFLLNQKTSKVQAKPKQSSNQNTTPSTSSSTSPSGKKERNTLTSIPKESDFEELWAIYPRRDGKKAALRHFNASVKSLADLEDLKRALSNYLAKIEHENIENRFIKNGGTFFNNWRDFLDYTPMLDSGKDRLRRIYDELG